MRRVAPQTRPQRQNHRNNQIIKCICQLSSPPQSPKQNNSEMGSDPPTGVPYRVFFFFLISHILLWPLRKKRKHTHGDRRYQRCLRCQRETMLGRGSNYRHGNSKPNQLHSLLGQGGVTRTWMSRLQSIETGEREYNRSSAIFKAILDIRISYF